MIVKNLYKTQSDFAKLSKSERTAYGIVIRLYQRDTESTERIKEKSLPIATLFNCVFTITEKLKNEEFPEGFINEIWDEIKYIRGKQNTDIKNQPIRNILNFDYEYNVNRWYEATVIFACVYVVLAIDCPEKVECLAYIKEKCAYNDETIPYFELFEKEVLKLKENQLKHPEAYGVEKEQTKEEQTKMTEEEWLASEKHFSWKYDRLRTMLSDKTQDDQFFEYVEEYKREMNMPKPSKSYLSLLDTQIQYLQRLRSKTNSPVINVNDIMEALKDHKFQNERSIEILEIINYVLHAKQYPDDICGHVSNKIKLLRQVDNTHTIIEDSLINSEIFLNSKRGSKIDFIRVVNCLYELEFFKSKLNNTVTKKIVFETIGKFVNVDLSNYDKDLSRSLSDNTALDKHLEIFHELENKMTDIFNSK